MSASGNAWSGGIRCEPWARSQIQDLGGGDRHVHARRAPRRHALGQVTTKWRWVSVLYAVCAGSRITPARCATEEWQLTVAQFGSMIAGAMYDHFAGPIVGAAASGQATNERPTAKAPK